MTLDPNTPVLRLVDGGAMCVVVEVRTMLAQSDIAEGNRYSAPGMVLKPDPEGPFVALVTHRGPDAPPRPETLPVGTRVRRGPDWSWDEQDGKPGNLGTVMGHGWQRWFLVKWDGAQGAVSYRHGGDYTGEFSGPLYDLEVVSLPEAPAEPKPQTPDVTFKAGHFERACVPPRTDVAVTDDVMQHASIDPEWVERALSSGGTRTFIQGAWSPDDVDVKREGDVFKVTYRAPDFIRVMLSGGPHAVGTYGPNPREILGSLLPAEDYTPAHVLARRKPVVSTPTDLDDHFLVDAEPAGIVPRR